MPKEIPSRKSTPGKGVWGTVDGAIQSGWGATFRLVLVMTAMSVLLVGLGLVVGHIHLADIVRAVGGLL